MNGKKSLVPSFFDQRPNKSPPGETYARLTPQPQQGFYAVVSSLTKQERDGGGA